MSVSLFVIGWSNTNPTCPAEQLIVSQPDVVMPTPVCPGATLPALCSRGLLNCQSRPSAGEALRRPTRRSTPPSRAGAGIMARGSKPRPARPGAAPGEEPGGGRSPTATPAATWKADTLEGLAKGSRVWMRLSDATWALGALQGPVGAQCRVALDSEAGGAASEVAPTSFMRPAYPWSPSASVWRLRPEQDCILGFSCAPVNWSSTCVCRLDSANC